MRGWRPRRSQALAEEGFTASRIELTRSVDAKYQNQLHEITIPIPSGRPVTSDDVGEIVAAFHRTHRQLYTFAVEDAPLDFYHWRLTALGRIPRHAQRAAKPVGADPTPRLEGSPSRLLLERVVTNRPPSSTAIACVPGWC